MKTCTSCGETKSLDEFYRRGGSEDGLRPSCKNCFNKATKDWRARNPIKPGYSSQQAKKWREANPGRAAQDSAAWRSANPGRQSELNKAYRNANPERVAATSKAWRAADPNRARAHGAVQIAVRDGLISPAASCEGCAKVVRTEAHHDSYDRKHWLDVRWLCKSCHKQHHLDERKRIEEQANAYQ